MLKGRGRVGSFKQPIQTSHKPLPIETHSWYWNPNRIGVKQAPEWFQEKLGDFKDEVKICWHPLRERWCVFSRAPKINHPVCNGWKLLFIWEDSTGYLPLDERVLANIWDRSGRKWGNLHEYWLKVEQAIERDREKSERSRDDDVVHSAKEYYDYTLIKNIGSGSKFANNHA